MHALIQEAEPVYLLAHGQPVRMRPSVSDGDISGQNKQKAKKDFIKKRPVSDVPAGKKPIDGLPPAGMKKWAELKKMGPLKVAALNGLTLSRLPLHEGGEEKPETSNHERCKELQQRMEQGMVFQEYEQVAKRRPAGDCSIAQLPESGERNRFQDVLPYDDTRVELVPSKENNTGYINASHIRMLDIPTVLNMLRQQRMMMVQTISQYSFIYKVLIQFLRNSRLI